MHYILLPIYQMHFRNFLAPAKTIENTKKLSVFGVYDSCRSSTFFTNQCFLRLQSFFYNLEPN